MDQAESEDHEMNKHDGGEAGVSTFESILLLPKLSHRETKGGRKKGAIKERIEAEKIKKVATDNTKEKGKDKGQVRPKATAKKNISELAVDTDPVLPNSIRSMQDRVCEVDDAYQSLSLPKLVLGKIASIKKDDFALAKVETKRTR